MSSDIDQGNVVIPNSTTRIQLSKFRTITISATENEQHAPSARFLIETYVTAIGQVKQFAFYIKIQDVPAIIDALTTIEQIGLDRGLITQIDDDQDGASNGGSGQVDGGAQ
jgi:hypothetical protein